MERRTLPSEPESTAVDEVRAILDALRREDRDVPRDRGRDVQPARRTKCRPTTSCRGRSRQPWRAPARTPRITGASFWTDAAVLGHAGIPSILFGPGGAGLHSTEEYVNIADVAMCRDALVQLVELWIG